MLLNCFVSKSKKKKRVIPKKIVEEPSKRTTKLLPSLSRKSCDNLINLPESANEFAQTTERTSMMASIIDDDIYLSIRMKKSLKRVMELSFLSWIQTHSIKPIIKGEDTLIKSPSGTGKTLSYAVPLIDRLASTSSNTCRKDGVFILIIVPTKELAKQTFDVFSRILRSFVWIQAGGIFGTDKLKSEKSRIRKGLNILISTPGRLYDHLMNTETLDLSKLKTVVIDEADLLLDMGYESNINQLFDKIENRYHIELKNLQFLLLSATLSDKVQSLCSSVLKNPVVINANPPRKVAIAQEYLSCNSQLRQTIVILPVKWRFVGLLWFIYYALQNSNSKKIILFVCSIYSVNYHRKLLDHFMISQKLLSEYKLEVYSLHGEMEIKDRMKTYDMFNECGSGILIATDVAARGLDFNGVSWVIQYDPARNPVDYVHRVGRTARAGAEGDAVVFLSIHEIEYVNILKESGMSIKQQFDLNMLGKIWLNSQNSSEKFIDNKIIESEGCKIHSEMKNLISKNSKLNILAAKCFTSCVKAYASYPRNLRKYFNPRNLHTGHLADSLGLDDTPKNINDIAKTGKIPYRSTSSKPKGISKRKITFQQDTKVTKKYHEHSNLSMSEYGSGL